MGKQLTQTSETLKRITDLFKAYLKNLSSSFKQIDYEVDLEHTEV